MARKSKVSKAVGGASRTKASGSSAKAAAKPPSGSTKAAKARGGVRLASMDEQQKAEFVKGLATLHTSLKAAATTPDQRADVGVVALAKQHAEQGDLETVGSYLAKLSGWVRDFARDHQPEIQAHVAHAFQQALKAYLR
jgi:hypothetical protein